MGRPLKLRRPSQSARQMHTSGGRKNLRPGAVVHRTHLCRTPASLAHSTPIWIGCSPLLDRTFDHGLASSLLYQQVPSLVAGPDGLTQGSSRRCWRFLRTTGVCCVYHTLTKCRHAFASRLIECVTLASRTRRTGSGRRVRV